MLPDLIYIQLKVIHFCFVAIPLTNAIFYIYIYIFYVMCLLKTTDYIILNLLLMLLYEQTKQIKNGKVTESVKSEKECPRVYIFSLTLVQLAHTTLTECLWVKSAQ